MPNRLTRAMGGWRRLAVVGSVAAVAASGCGDDSSDGSSEERLKKADYQAKILAVLEDTAEPTGLYTDLVVGPKRRKNAPPELPPWKTKLVR